MAKVYATISAGSVEYSKKDAEIEIEELIAQLEYARKEGVTHVLGLSDNYRGAQYVRLGEVQLDYEMTDEDEDEDADWMPGSDGI